jgi:hypothetical protein
MAGIFSVVPVGRSWVESMLFSAAGLAPPLASSSFEPADRVAERALLLIAPEDHPMTTPGIKLPFLPIALA